MEPSSLDPGAHFQKVLEFTDPELLQDYIPESAEKPYLDRYLSGEPNCKYAGYDEALTAEDEWARPFLLKPSKDVKPPMFASILYPSCNHQGMTKTMRPDESRLQDEMVAVISAARKK